MVVDCGESRECIIENKAHSNEYLFQSKLKHRNVFINACMKPIHKITDLDNIKWIIRFYSNNRITFACLILNQTKILLYKNKQI